MRPKPGENNVWFRNEGSDAAIVFVHGIFSDSASCWQSANMGTTPGTFWPELVTTDPRLGKPDIFLAGFYTKFNAGPSAIRNCADEVYQGISIPDSKFQDAPINRKRLLFVCHSAGGIVVRQLLVFHFLDLREKEVGLLLIASPSAGSKWATRFGGLARLYDYKLARELAWNSWSLVNLDDGFRNMLDQHQIPKLRGKEAYENRFILGPTWLPNRGYVVEPSSAGRYFGPAQLLPDTDHSTAVKPPNLEHPAHRLLVQFSLQLDRDFKDKDLKKADDTAQVQAAPPVALSTASAVPTTSPASSGVHKGGPREDDPFHEFMESAMLSGSFFVEDPWVTGSSPAVVDFKKKLRDASEQTADLHNRDEWERLIGLWSPIASDPLFRRFSRGVAGSAVLHPLSAERKMRAVYGAREPGGRRGGCGSLQASACTVETGGCGSSLRYEGREFDTAGHRRGKDRE